MGMQALPFQCIWEQYSQPWGRDAGCHGHCQLNLDSFVLKGRPTDRLRDSRTSENCYMTEGGKASGLPAIPVGFGKGVPRKHAPSSRVTKDTLGEDCGMAVCQTALVLPE